MPLTKLDAATTKFFEDAVPGSDLTFAVAIFRSGKIELFGSAKLLDAKEVELPFNPPKQLDVIEFDSITTMHTATATYTCWTNSAGQRKWWWV